MKNCKGVTLMMVLLTVVMLAIMTGLVLRHASNTMQKAKLEKFKAEVTAIEKVIQIEYEDANLDDMGDWGDWEDYFLTEAQLTQLEDILSTSEMQEISHNLYYNDFSHPREYNTYGWLGHGWLYITQEQFKTDFDIDWISDNYFIYLSEPVVLVVAEHGIKVNGEMKHTIYGVQ